MAQQLRDALTVFYYILNLLINASAHGPITQIQQSALLTHTTHLFVAGHEACVSWQPCLGALRDPELKPELETSQPRNASQYTLDPEVPHAVVSECFFPSMLALNKILVVHHDPDHHPLYTSPADRPGAQVESRYFLAHSNTRFFTQ